MKTFDNSFLTDTVKLIAGTDEAGRGPLAGPVVAAAVVFAPDVYIEGVNDSKKLSEHKREKLFPLIIEKSLSYSVCAVSQGRIDEMNILKASLFALRTSVSRLKIQPDIVLVDGNKTFSYPVPAIPVIKGDAKSFAIAAASILAKVTRDRIMNRLNNYFPAYLWSKNKGYPTKEHIELIRKFGPCCLHRKSFLRKILVEDSSFNIVLPVK